MTKNEIKELIDADEAIIIAIDQLDVLCQELQNNNLDRAIPIVLETMKKRLIPSD